MADTILLAAGGTGGHLFPAESLAVELGRRGFTVHLATDHRADKYGRAFPAAEIHIVSSETVRGRDPVSLMRFAVRLGRGFLQALGLMRRLKPKAVVGFGGYPTFPPLVAARVCGVPTVLHEQNAVMGRANRALAGGVSKIALSFEATDLIGDRAAKAVLTGNPVRPMVIEAAAIPYEAPVPGGVLKLLVFGGSQGARFFSELVPPAIALLTPEIRARLAIVQQARAEDLAGVETAYAQAGVTAEVAPFFVDLPRRIADSHLVLCRSGASSVTELAVIGRPALMVPLPGLLDQDQAANARVLEAAGGGWTMPQATLTPAVLAQAIERFMAAPDELVRAAAAARAQGRPDAVVRLADVVEAAARGR
ncbi:UDP-N-acetylglucosamine--N-acetylmuramyl-(pentapeptide) pyrophosphoryl-undecaprenol N-acetylglucosamine transferase [Methyloraptor flagellatus]|uniref:UDP-N-acetylglucosamine--N-acetylmuramyl-(pentapeptide) pyrophosphoryl-undecaprenol N-acetylglucosamine transferase n=1 Tax=Methyloraptor flagellatus TaxID=3162530 RepID=A0AAU7XBM0_9HYPH